MLSPQTLERVSVAYRRGYYDGYDGTNRGANVKPEYIKPFASFDYAEGLKAGRNDRYWSDYYEACEINRAYTRPTEKG